jgi:hypothetical protein
LDHASVRLGGSLTTELKRSLVLSTECISRRVILTNTRYLYTAFYILIPLVPTNLDWLIPGFNHDLVNSNMLRLLECVYNATRNVLRI